jgi:hypothetical protein
MRGVAFSIVLLFKKKIFTTVYGNHNTPPLDRVQRQSTWQCQMPCVMSGSFTER